MRAATLLAAVYVLCVLTAPLALAFAGPAQASAFASGHHAGVQDHSGAHHHGDDGAPHEHQGQADDHANGAACCGVLCLNALSVDVAMSFHPHFSARTIVVALDDSVDDRGPDRLHRPPIALLSL